MANAAGEIPYGFRYQPQLIDSQTGAYTGRSSGEGFTCATFVMAVFKRMALTLLNSETWPNRENDRDWQSDLLRLLGNDANPEGTLHA